jgi:hypothetical protein
MSINGLDLQSDNPRVAPELDETASIEELYIPTPTNEARNESHLVLDK